MLRRTILGAILATALAGPVAAQGQNPVLTLDMQEVFAQSAWGRRVQAELVEQGRVIAAENERLAQAFSAEEDQLTQLRATLTPAEFRKRAEDFDARTQKIRQERALAAQQLSTHLDQQRAAFLQATLPVFGTLMDERGASVLLDRQSVVMSSDAIDVTAEIIIRIDAELGDGSDWRADTAVPLPDQSSSAPDDDTRSPAITVPQVPLPGADP